MLTLIIILLPLLSGFLVWLLKGQNSKQLAFGAAIINLSIGAYLLLNFTANATSQFNFNFKWISSANINFSIGIDGISILLVLLTVLLVPLIILSTFNKKIENEPLFYGLILMMQAALIGVFTAKDAFLFYFFFEVALIPIYFITAIWGGENRIKVTFKFLIYTIFGSLFMLLALVYLYYQTPGAHSANIVDFYNLKLSASQQSLIFGAIFLAFAIKMPLFPFHTWQPDTYVEAPSAGTMLLSGIMLKMGTYGLLRILLPTVPLAVHQWGYLAIILSIIGIIYGSIIAIQQNDIKRLIAYSSFAHVGLMAAGIFSLTLSGIQGSLIQMLAHGINVVGLFFVAEIIFRRTNTHNLSDLGAITKNTPNLTVYFIVIVLGSVALPLTNGFVGEFLLLKGLYEYHVWAGAVAGLTIILGAIYMLRLVQKSMFGGEKTLTDTFTDLTFSEKATFLPIALLVIILGIAPNYLLKLTEPAVNQLVALINKF
jgi:NADH-quinone oxidoreductase subunit M